MDVVLKYILLYYHTDRLGSGSAVTDGSGEAVHVLGYMPYGETLIDLSHTHYETPYQFTGYEKDQETGLHYAEARYYDSRLSIFNSTDPMWYKYPHQSPYTYCSNNPIMRIDPDGRADDWYEYTDKDGNSQAMWLRDHQSPTYTDENGNIWNNIGTSYDIGNYRLEQCQNAEGGYYLRGVKTNDYSTPWMDSALKELSIGVEEVPGQDHNSRILEYHSTTSLKAKTDEVPWCSSFVNWCFTQNGIQGTNSAAASSWANWGQDLGQNPAYGSIGLEAGGKNGVRHVGFTIGYSKNGGIRLLGGNQGYPLGTVRISEYKRGAKFAGFRYPNGYTPTYLKK